jgi:hypothetical protein
MSAYAPQPKNPTGETHNDIGLFSYDSDANYSCYANSISKVS